MTQFSTWLDTLLSEKGIDPEAILTAEGPSGPNYIPVGILADALKAASPAEQFKVKNAIVRLDFVNAPIVPFLAHIARAIAI